MKINDSFIEQNYKPVLLIKEEEVSTNELPKYPDKSIAGLFIRSSIRTTDYFEGMKLISKYHIIFIYLGFQGAN